MYEQMYDSFHHIITNIGKKKTKITIKPTWASRVINCILCLFIADALVSRRLYPRCLPS